MKFSVVIKFNNSVSYKFQILPAFFCFHIAQTDDPLPYFLSVENKHDTWKLKLSLHEKLKYCVFSLTSWNSQFLSIDGKKYSKIFCLEASLLTLNRSLSVSTESDRVTFIRKWTPVDSKWGPESDSEWRSSSWIKQKLKFPLKLSRAGDGETVMISVSSAALNTASTDGLWVFFH